MTRSTFTDLCLAAWVILYWFVSGVTLLQGWSNYPTWLDMGPMMSNEDFLHLRQAHYWLIYPLAVIPGMVSLVLNAVLVWLRPWGINWWLLLIQFATGLVIAVSTMVVQIPLQDRIDAMGYDRELIQHLIDTDLWARKIPGLIGMSIMVLLTWQAVRRRTA
ncbi:MAG: hypothetical protein KF911_01400 [Pseudomonadales bacterium]|nr:hypothetical protein [Pseudomonadales bacterium]